MRLSNRVNTSRIVLTLIVIIALGLVGWFAAGLVADRRLSRGDARQAYQRGNYDEALRICEQLLERDADNSGLLIMAGQAARQIGQDALALEFFDRVNGADRRQAALARWSAAELLSERRRMSAAIAMIERCLELDPENVPARNQLIVLLNLSGQRWRAYPHLFYLLQNGRWTVQNLLYIGNLAKPVENEPELKSFLAGAPDDPLPQLGIAKIRLRAGDHRAAQNALAAVLQGDAQLLEAYVQQGKLWLASDPQQIPIWNQSIPSQADTHPDVWVIRGQWARDDGQLLAAVRCFAEALRLDPENLAAHNALAQMLNRLNQPERAQRIIDRAANIEKLVGALEHIMSNEWSVRQALAASDSGARAGAEEFTRSPEHLAPIIDAATSTCDLGRIWESKAWCTYGLSFDPANTPLLKLAARAQTLFDPGEGRTRRDHQIVDPFWLQSFPLPRWPKIDVAGNRPPRPLAAIDSSNPGANAESGSPVRFDEDTASLDFRYFASRDRFDDGRRMFEMTGGGAGVLDYDRDGWPDVFLAQGCRWPVDGQDRQHSDRLKRNRAQLATAGNLFTDTTAQARITESAFGAGIATGDVNSDGFDDIYVCNVGVNQLWLNQGDGTFISGAHLFADRPPDWTLSAAIADLDGDGRAEIYDANYVAGEDAYTRRCVIGGQPRACSPLNFQRSKGRLWTQDAAGSFHDNAGQVIEESVEDGYAMGLLAMRMKNQRALSLFVANDQVANLMLTSRPEASSPLGMRLEDRAALMGVAFDADGNAQACMGVASGDINNDGLIDLLVTNYHDEPNTLYVQQPDGTFQDATRSWGLVSKSLKMLGFGAQFIDAQCDGNLDLVVLNGHIDDMSHLGIPYRMPAQFFVGDGRARLTEQRDGDTGPYFQQQRLGRALATADFNRDGRPDLIATELEGAAAVLHNATSSIGNSLALTLVGTRSHRDAIGAEVTCTAGERTWTHQLVAGCGYMVTNEKAIHIGIGQASRVDRLEIDWPSGLKQSSSDVPAGGTWLAIEGRPELIALP